MRILIACEFSGIVRDAFRNRGHDARSCDLRYVKAYKAGQKAGAAYRTENFHYRMATGRDLVRPACPYNGAELCADWQAGFDSKAGK